MIEVDQTLRPENHLRVMRRLLHDRSTKEGSVRFRWRRAIRVRVFDGEGLATESGHRIELKGGHELNLAMGADVKSHGFDKKAVERFDLYNWSRLRSSCLAEANITQARVYAGGPDFFGAGWYWNPWYSAYTFIPGDGFFYNPFGWGFYSPWLVYRAPFFGFYGGYRTFGRYAPPAAFVGGYRGGIVAGARFAPAPAFHSMGGGFHGGRR